MLGTVIKSQRSTGCGPSAHVNAYVPTPHHARYLKAALRQPEVSSSPERGQWVSLHFEPIRPDRRSVRATPWGRSQVRQHYHEPYEYRHALPSEARSLGAASTGSHWHHRTSIPRPSDEPLPEHHASPRWSRHGRMANAPAETSLDPVDDPGLQGRSSAAGHRRTATVPTWKPWMQHSAVPWTTRYLSTASRHHPELGPDRFNPVQPWSRCTGTHVIHVISRPDPAHISTSYVVSTQPHVADEHAALDLLDQRIHSRKLENHAAAEAIYMFEYDFIKPHPEHSRTPPRRWLPDWHVPGA